MNKWLARMIPVFLLVSHSALAEIDSAYVPSAPSLRSEHERSILLSSQVANISLGDAVFLGLRNNRNVRSAYLQRVAQKFDLRVAEDEFNPQWVLSSNYQVNRGSQDKAHQSTVASTVNLLSEFGTRLSMSWTQRLDKADVAGRYRSDGVDLSIIQPLMRGAGRDVTTAPMRLAQLNEQANRLNLKSSVAQTISDIILSYRELLRSQEQLSIAQEALKRTQALLDVNNALIAAGQMAEFESVQTEADIASQELGVEEAQNEVDINRLSLLQLLALDLKTAVRANEALEASRVSINASEAFRIAQVQQPQYLASLLGSAQADLNVLMAKDRSRWELDLVVGANQIRDQLNDQAGQRQWDSYAGVRLQIPIGDLSARQGVVRAQVDQQSQALALADARQALEREVSDVVRDLGTFWRQYEISQRAVDLSRRKLEIEREKLNAGRSSNFQVISFEGDLRQAQNARLNALISYLNAQTQLDLTLGTTLESWEIALNDY